MLYPWQGFVARKTTSTGILPCLEAFEVSLPRWVAVFSEGGTVRR